MRRRVIGCRTEKTGRGAVRTGAVPKREPGIPAGARVRGKAADARITAGSRPGRRRRRDASASPRHSGADGHGGERAHAWLLTEPKGARSSSGTENLRTVRYLPPSPTATNGAQYSVCASSELPFAINAAIERRMAS